MLNFTKRLRVYENSFVFPFKGVKEKVKQTYIYFMVDVKNAIQNQNNYLYS